MTQNNNSTHSAPTSDKSMIRRFAPLIVIVAVMATAFNFGLHEYLSIRSIALNLEQMRAFLAENYLTSIAIFIGVYILVAALSIPGGLILTIAGGLLFGWVIGTLATVIGATIGATLIFLVAKTSLGETLRAKAGPWLDEFQKGFDEDAFSYLMFLRLVPAFPFWLVNLAPAFLGVKLSTYVITTFFGIIPGSLAYSFLGQGFESVITAQRDSYQACLAEQGPEAASTINGCKFELDASSLVTTEILIAFLLLSLVALTPVAIKRLRKSNKPA